MLLDIRPVITVIAFNRPKALERLLNSLEDADYQFKPTLYISLEGEASDTVVRVAEQFASNKLDVRLIRHERKLGLRNHILKCGDFSIDHGAVIILEDDLCVDRYFYLYAYEAINHYKSDLHISGIALYGPEYNEYACLPFTPMKNGFCTYMMQIPCSWGQCWSKEQWINFKNWYAETSEENLKGIEGLPNAVKSWPESSWKKYFAAYMVSMKKFFIYPYDSYSTNCSDAGGTHISKGTHLLQVNLAINNRPKPYFSFCPTDNSQVAYDAYMEQMGEFIFAILKLETSDVAFDLYGEKPYKELSKAKYIISRRRYGTSLQSYPLSFRPIEKNLLYPLLERDNGGIFLSRVSEIKPQDKNILNVESFSYYLRVSLFAKRIVFALGIELIRRLFRR